MTARFAASVAFGLVLASVAGAGTGCTVHTYSGAAYPGTTFAHSKPVRYETSFRSTDRERPKATPREVERAETRPASRTPNDSKITVVDRERWTARDTHGNGSWVGATAKANSTARESSAAKPVAEQPARDKPSTTKPSTAKPTSTEERADTVTLEPTTPRDEHGGVRPFDERLGEVFEQKKAEIARAKKERKARTERAVAAAMDKSR